MKKTFKCISLSAILVAATALAGYAQDKKIFGILELNVPTTLSECHLELKDFQYLGDQQGGLLGKLTSRKRWVYEYDKAAPVSAPCYERPYFKDVVYNKKSEIPPLPLARPSRWVLIKFPENAAPAMVAENTVLSFFLDDGRVDGAFFRFNKNEADSVFANLKKKYGQRPKITPMKWQNSTGAVVEYYIAEWDLPTFKVTMESAGVSFWIDILKTNFITASVYMDSNSPFSSPYGLVKIANKSKADIEGKAPEKNKIPL